MHFHTGAHYSTGVHYYTGVSHDYTGVHYYTGVEKLLHDCCQFRDEDAIPGGIQERPRRPRLVLLPPLCQSHDYTGVHITPKVCHITKRVYIALRVWSELSHD